MQTVECKVDLFAAGYKASFIINFAGIDQDPFS